MLPADLADRTRRWHFSSSVREDGFRTDQAEIEYASIDAATYQAVANEINNAQPTDSFAIVVWFEDAPVELFRGIVTSWRLEQRWRVGGVETVGVLRAQDERGKLLRQAAPTWMAFPGVTFNPQTGQMLGGTTFAAAVAQIGQQVGIEISSSVDYTLMAGAVLAGYSLGQAVAFLLEPLQVARGIRADFVRRGQVYEIRARSLVLGSPDVTIPLDRVKLRSYEVSKPKPPEEFGAEGEPEVTDYPQSSCSSFSGPGYSGTACQFYSSRGLLLSDTTVTTYQTEEGGTHVVINNTLYFYQGQAPHRQIGSESESIVNGVLESTSSHLIFYDNVGRVFAETTATYQRDDDGAMKIASTQIVLKGQTGGGTMKSAFRTRISEDEVEVLPAQHETAAGGTAMDWEEFDFTRRPADGPTMEEIAAQLGLLLVDLEVDVPLDPRCQAGTVIEFEDMLVDTRRFYVTGVEADWVRDRATHEMRLRGEAWQEPPP